VPFGRNVHVHGSNLGGRRHRGSAHISWRLHRVLDARAGDYFSARYFFPTAGNTWIPAGKIQSC